ncbi:MAG: S8 family peptidase [Betaproteobacteria bacterium]
MNFRSLRQQALAGLLSVLFLISGSAASQDSPPPLPTAATAFAFDLRDTPASQQVKDYLFRKVRYAGAIRLIVGLRTDVAPEHLLSAAAVAAQHQRINAAQRDFVQTAHDGREIKRFQTVPYVVMEGNEAFLASLFARKDLTTLQEDIQHQPSLPQSIPLIQADKAWAAGATGAGQIVAIVDTGVDSTHPFLAGKVIAEACYSTNGAGSSSLCPNRQNEQVGLGAGRECAISGCIHGTHVAGIAAGKGSSFSGVAREAKLIAVQVFTSFSAGCGTPPCLSAYTSDIMRGLEYVYSLRGAYRIAAVNMSLGGGAFTSYCDTDALKSIIDNLRGAGIASVVASGNDGRSNAISSPACISSAISVGATTKSDTVASYSNSASFLTLLAPGSSILSSVPGGGFATMSGTSMATPHVSGAFAALRTIRPGASVDQIRSAMITSGKPIRDPRNLITKSRLNVYGAVAQLTNTFTTATGCSTASNTIHVSVGRAYVSNYVYARARGSNQYMGPNNSTTITKLRQTGTDYYVVDNTCP